MGIKHLNTILFATRQGIAIVGVTDFLREGIFYYFKIAEFTIV